MAQFNFDNLPNEAFIRQGQLIKSGLVPFSASTLWRRVRECRFPRPTKLGDQITAWRVGDIREWLQCPDSFIAATDEHQDSKPAAGKRGAP